MALYLGDKKVTYTRVIATAPKLNAPTIAQKSASQITITSPSSNGSFVKGYNVYVDGKLERSINTPIGGSSSITVDYVLDMSKYVGIHNIQATVTGGADFTESDKSNQLSFTIYAVNANLTNISLENNTLFAYKNSTYTDVLIPVGGYYLPTTIELAMSGKDLSLTGWNDETGVISIPNVDGNITLTASAITENKLRTPYVELNYPELSIRKVENATDYAVYMDDKTTPIWTKNIPLFDYAVSQTSQVATQQFGLNAASFWESKCQKVSNGWSLCKITFTGSGSVTLHCISSGESSYDYGIIGNINQTLASSNTDDGATGSTLVKKNFKGETSTSIKDVVFDSVSNGDFIMCKYRKDSSSDQQNDSLQFQVDLGGAGGSIVIEDISQYSGDVYGLTTFKAQATDSTGVHTASDFSNVVSHTLPLLSISVTGTTLNITHFIDGVTGVDIYANNVKIGSLTRSTEEALTYDLSSLESNKFYSIYAVATGTGIKENKSNVVSYGVNPTFSENTWEAIHAISDNIAKLDLTGDDLYAYITQNYGWSVGDTKTVTLLNGDTYTLQIWDFNNAVDKDGNKNGILLGNVELLTTLAKMNDTKTNKGGFGASAMATTTLPAVYETLPDDLKNVIRETKVTYHSGSDDPDTELSGYYKLYLPSEFEMFGTTSDALQEGQYLKYWQTHNTDKDREKTQLGQSSSHWYWLRSAYLWFSNDFAIVIETGSTFFIYSDETGGVCLMFSI